MVAKYSILIADGDPDTIQYLSGTLRANGFDSSGTSSGTDALNIYKKNSPDFVVADLVLAEMDGMQLLDELREYDPKAKVILTTSGADKDTVARAFRMGALDILEKPLDSEYLISKIRDFLAREDRDLEGNLQLMSLASIIQINCEERNRAQLTINHLGKAGIIFFEEGEIIHAETEGLVGEDAIYSLLTWEEGSFQVKMGAEPRSRTIDRPWSGLLLEGMRRIDESTAAWSPEWEEEEEQPTEDTGNQIEERIVKALSSIRDVESALICSGNGTVIAQDKCADPESEVDLGEFIQTRTDLISGFMDGGILDRIILSGSDKRIYMQLQDDNLIILSLAKKSSSETVWQSVQTIYKRYRSA